MDTGSRPAPDIGSSCPAPKSAGGLFVIPSRSFSLPPSFFRTLLFLLCLCSFRTLYLSAARSLALSLARAKRDDDGGGGFFLPYRRPQIACSSRNA